jgi:hypothetical protein
VAACVAHPYSAGSRMLNHGVEYYAEPVRSVEWSFVNRLSRQDPPDINRPGAAEVITVLSPFVEQAIPWLRSVLTNISGFRLSAMSSPISSQYGEAS